MADDVSGSGGPSKRKAKLDHIASRMSVPIEPVLTPKEAQAVKDATNSEKHCIAYMKLTNELQLAEAAQENAVADYNALLSASLSMGDFLLQGGIAEEEPYTPVDRAVSYFMRSAERTNNLLETALVAVQENRTAAEAHVATCKRKIRASKDESSTSSTIRAMPTSCSNYIS